MPIPFLRLILVANLGYTTKMAKSQEKNPARLLPDGVWGY
jgi:hypothetical protein